MPDIVHEDEQILVLEKPAGLVVNRSDTIREETLQDQIASYLNLGANLGLGERVGIVHRLDRETSGLLVVAKTQKAFDFLQEQFRERQVFKKYIALVHAWVKEDQVIEAATGRIGKFGKFGVVKDGREARTDLVVADRLIINDNVIADFAQKEGITKPKIKYLISHASSYTLVSAFPKTGRTHQIRIHLKHIGHPVVSDEIYAPNKLLKFDKFWCPRLFLHAAELEFTHPKSRKHVSFASALPNDLKRAILNLN